MREGARVAGRWVRRSYASRWKRWTPGGGVGVIPYSCDYTLAVFVGNIPGSETLLATGQCSTSSYEPYDPAHLTCTAILDVTVP
jgi:hypothetical protein